jgi:hypothetical protein
MAYDHDMTYAATRVAQDSSDYAVYTRVIAQGQGTANYNVALNKSYGGFSASGAYKRDNLYGGGSDITTTVSGASSGLTLNLTSVSGLAAGMTLYIFKNSTFQVAAITGIVGSAATVLNTLNPSLTGGEAVTAKAVVSQSVADNNIAQIFDTSPKTPQVAGTDPFNYGRLYELADVQLTRQWSMADEDIFWVDLGRNAYTGNAWLIDYLEFTSFNPFKNEPNLLIAPQTIYLYYMTEPDFVSTTGYQPSQYPGDHAVETYMQQLQQDVSWQLLTDTITCTDGQNQVTSSQFLNPFPTKFRFLKVRLVQGWYQFPPNGRTGGSVDFTMSDLKVWLSRNVVRTAELGYSPSFNDTTTQALAATLMRRTIILDQNLALSNTVLAEQFALNDLRELATDFIPTQFEFELCPVQLYDTLNYIDPETGTTSKLFASDVRYSRDGHSLTGIDYSKFTV